LPGGNTLVCEGETGTVFEVTLAGDEVWRYVTPSLAVDGSPSRLFRARRYPSDHAGVARLLRG